jgi:DNA polymerase-3 subunit delta
MARSSDHRTPCVYALVGADPFIRGEALRKLLKTVLEGFGEMPPAKFDGERSELAEVLDEVRTPSLLSEHRVAIVQDADEFIKRYREPLERYCAGPCETGVLILLCDSLPRNTRLFRILQEHGGIVACEAPKGRAVVEWIVTRAREAHGKRLDQQTAERLRDRLGDDLGLLDAELSKLATYIAQRDTITVDDVADLTADVREEKVFAVTDAITSGDAAGALRAWERVVATDPASPHRAVAGLAYGVRRLLEARRDWQAGTNINELARRLYTDPMTLHRRLEAMAVEQLEDMQRALLEADIEVKTGLTTTERAVEKFIVKHSVAGRSGRQTTPREASYAG